MDNHNGNATLLANHAAMLAPSARRTGGRKSWGIDVESVLVPYFTAANVAGLTAMPEDVLGAPLRLAKKDGEIRFSSTGRPVMRVAPELTDQVNIMRENYIASLQNFTGLFATERPEEYREHVEALQAAGMPIIEAAQRDVFEAIKLLREQAEKASATEETPEGPSAEMPKASENSKSGSKTPKESEPVAA